MSDAKTEAVEKGLAFLGRFIDDDGKVSLTMMRELFDEQSRVIASQQLARSSLFNENCELQRKLKIYEPISLYNGVGIEEWHRRAVEAEAKLAASTAAGSQE